MISSPKARGGYRRAAFLIGLAFGAWAAAPAFAAGSMTIGGLTSQPIGHYEFCRANPSAASALSRSGRPRRDAD